MIRGGSGTVDDLLRAVARTDAPIPADDAPDAAWDAWTAYQEFEAAATGLASRGAWAGALPHLDRMRALLAEDGVRSLLGDRLATAEQLVAALEQRHRAQRG